MNANMIKKDARKFFRDLKKRKLLSEVDYKLLISVVYDTTLGEDVSVFKTKKMDCFLTSFNRNELTNDVRSTDIKGIILKEDMPSNFAIDDFLTFDNDEYTVISFLNNPKDPIVVLQLRGGA